MMRQILFLLFFFFILPFPALAGPSPGGRNFTVFFSNDVQGKIEPCG